MRWKSRFALLTGGAVIAHIALAAPPKAEQKVTGPVATYWVSAATTSGSGMMGMGGSQSGGRPSMGEVMRMMRGGNQTNHSLELKLGSSLKSADPKADHTPGALAPLPLLTPSVAPPSAPVADESVEEQPAMPQRPKGRMLIYWGCGEHAAKGQPYVIDFSRIGASQPMPRFPFVPIHHQNPPAAGRFATYGEWPNARSRALPPASLVGDHLIHGSYTPDIHFALPPGKDYLAPLAIDTSGKSPGGATLLAWQPVAGATGYFAAMFGASPGNDGETTIVMWSSSALETFAGGGLLDYLAPAEVRRLIGQKVVMPPAQTQCAIPAEVTSSAPMGMLQMIAYGDEANFADPPRPADPRVPWNISWTTKVRYKSTAGVMLGMPSMGAGMAQNGAPDTDDDKAVSEQAPPPKKKKGGWMSVLKDAANAIPH